MLFRSPGRRLDPRAAVARKAPGRARGLRHKGRLAARSGPGDIPAGTVPAILASSAFQNGGLLVITWDEGSSSAGCCGNASGGQVASLVIAPNTIAGLRSTTSETHYSLLRTIEDAWGLAPLGQAANTAAMREYFH